MYLLKIAFPSHPTTHLLNWWGEFLYSSCSYQCSYSSTPSARVRYPFGKQKGEKGKETFGKQPSVNIRVVTKWYAKVPPTISPEMSYRCPCYLFYVLLYFLTMGIVREQYSKCHSRHFFIYAHANSSEWGLIGHFARSAFRRTPSGRLICRGFLVKMQHKQHFFI